MQIVVDIGGTTTRVAASKDGKKLTSKDRFPTPQSFEEGISRIIETSKHLAGSSPVSSVSLGVPGTINHGTGQVYFVPHILSWNGQYPGKALEEALGVPVKLANDAELAALGEAALGAGKDYRIVACLTLGTGIGGALVVDKKLYPRLYNSEPGHMPTWGNTLDAPGRDWEDVASGPGFEERFNIKPQDCRDPGTWALFAQSVGVGLINVIQMWSPEVVVIGGGLSLNGEIFLAPLREFVAKNLRVFPPPPIVAAALGDDAGLYGGLVINRSREPQ